MGNRLKQAPEEVTVLNLNKQIALRWRYETWRSSCAWGQSKIVLQRHPHSHFYNILCVNLFYKVTPTTVFDRGVRKQINLSGLGLKRPELFHTSKVPTEAWLSNYCKVYLKPRKCKHLRGKVWKYGLKSLFIGQ